MLRGDRHTEWSDNPYAEDYRDPGDGLRYCFKGGGGGTTTNTTVQSNDLPEYLKPYYLSGLEAAEADVLNRPTEFFGGQTYADFSPETEAALSLQTGRAVGGSPLVSQAQGYNTDVLAGNFLDPGTNPYLSQLGDAVRSEVVPGVTSAFARGGRSGGSPLEMEAISKGIARGLAPHLFGQYGAERSAMESAASRAPDLAREDYFDIAQLGRVGGQREQQTQRGINEAMSRFTYGRDEPVNRIGQYMGLLQGVPVAFNQTGNTMSRQNQDVDSGMYMAGMGMRALGGK